MSSKIFKTLTFICLPALLFALTYTVSLNASDSQSGNRDKCSGSGYGYKCGGDIGYNWLGYLNDGTSKKCTDRKTDAQCGEGYGMARHIQPRSVLKELQLTIVL